MKPSFLNNDKPLIVGMIQCRTPRACIAKIKESIKAGADAIGFQLCVLKRKYRTKEILTKIFNVAKGLPIYVTNYNRLESSKMTDDERMDELFLALECGGTLLDIQGDTYSPSPQYQITEDEGAIKKQKELIDKIHLLGGEVLMSSHTFKSTTIEENLMIAKAQAERGADVIKIVNTALSEEEIPKYITAIQKIQEMTDKKLLFLVSGKGQILRYIGPNFGVVCYLCVSKHNDIDTPEQPLIKNIKKIRDSIAFKF